MDEIVEIINSLDFADITNKSSRRKWMTSYNTWTRRNFME